MKAVNYSELRENLKANLDAVSDNDELLVVHRPRGKSIIMMSLDEYNSLFPSAKSLEKGLNELKKAKSGQLKGKPARELLAEL
jgi:antitoxin YefM